MVSKATPQRKGKVTLVFHRKDRGCPRRLPFADLPDPLHGDSSRLRPETTTPSQKLAPRVSGWAGGLRSRVLPDTAGRWQDLFRERPSGSYRRNLPEH
jgi:hypothetical protein